MRKIKYHDKKFPHYVAVRLTTEQVKKLGENRSATIRNLIDNHDKPNKNLGTKILHQ